MWWYREGNKEQGWRRVGTLTPSIVHILVCSMCLWLLWYHAISPLILIWATLATCISHTLVKVTWYKLPSRRAIAITSPSNALTMHSFMLNCTLLPLDKILLTESKLACNFGTWSTSLILILLVRPFTITFHKDGPHSYCLNNVIITHMHVACCNYFIHVECDSMRGHMVGGSRVHDPLAYGLAMVSILCCKGIVIIVLGFVGILLLLVVILGLEAKSCNVARFATIVACLGVFVCRCGPSSSLRWHHCHIVTLRLLLPPLGHFMHQSCGHKLHGEVLHGQGLQGGD